MPNLLTTSHYQTEGIWWQQAFYIHAIPLFFLPLTLPTIWTSHFWFSWLQHMKFQVCSVIDSTHKLFFSPYAFQGQTPNLQQKVLLGICKYISFHSILLNYISFLLHIVRDIDKGYHYYFCLGSASQLCAIKTQLTWTFQEEITPKQFSSCMRVISLVAKRKASRFIYLVFTWATEVG